MGPNCHFYPGSKVWAPWNLICDDQVTAGEWRGDLQSLADELRLARDSLARQLSLRRDA